MLPMTMATLPIKKEEVLDEEEETSTATPTTATKSSRKRVREDEQLPQEDGEGPPPAIRIKNEVDLLEPSEDEPPLEGPSSPPPPTTRIKLEPSEDEPPPPPPPEEEGGPPPAIRIKNERDLLEPQENEDEDSLLPPPATATTSMEEDDDLRTAVASMKEEDNLIKAATPKTEPADADNQQPELPDVVTDEDGAIPLRNCFENPLFEQEQACASDDEAKARQHIDDQSEIGNANDGDSDGDDVQFNNAGASTNEGGFFERQQRYAKYDFNHRHINTTSLAVNSSKEEILEAIENHRVVIIDGFTGCGKTTQVPQFILDKQCQNMIACNIVVTQPRKIAAISVARRVCDERNWNLGDVVGYQVGMDTKKNKDTLLTYMTTGVLLQRLIATRNFGNMTHIIIDEVHERDLESDLLLLVIKKILQDDIEGKQRYVKFILMSATLNAEKFSRYFPMRTGQAEVEASPVIKILPTFRHNVEELFLDTILSSNRAMLDILVSSLSMETSTIHEDMYTVAVDCIVNLDDVDRKMARDPRVNRDTKHSERTRNRGSVLVFLPGMEEINRLFRSLTVRNAVDLEEAIKKDRNYKEHDFHQWEIVPLHSTIALDEQQKVFQRPKNYYRKIILSTNIAESSVTVPDVMYVIDFCLTKSMCIDPDTNFTTLRMVWASVSQCVQRKGRTGRVCDGKVYRLVSRSFFWQLPQDTQPEMLRANLETVVLQLKKLNLDTPKELLSMALDPPDVSGIKRAVSNLKELGALTIFTTKWDGTLRHYDTCDGDLTFLGAVMTDLPIPQQCTRLIMLGHCFGVMKEAIIIAAALSVKNPFSTPFVRSLDAYLSRLNWSRKSCSDLFALYHLYKHWIKQFAENSEANYLDGNRSRTTYNERQWARGASVQLSVLREIKSTVELIEERLRRQGPHLASNPLSTDSSSDDLAKEAGIMLKLAIAGAFYPNYFHRRRPDVKTYEREKSREINGLDLYNTVYFKGFPGGHDGKIYAKFVADYLSFGLNVPSITFDGQKVLATFDNRGEKIGPINKGLYRAVKRRQIRDMLEIPITRRESEKRILEDWEHKLKNRRFTRCSPQVALPGVDVSRLYVRVTHVENPGQFWINYFTNTKALDEMVDRINEEAVHMPIHSSKIVVNAICLASFEGRYYRAKILLVLPRPMVDSLVFFIDYGNTAWVKNSTLEDFSPSMVEKRYNTIPCLAVECRLSNIKPATIHGAGWHDTAKLEFQMFTENAPFVYIDIYSVSKSVIAGQLIGHDDRRVERNLNHRLVYLGFAEPMEEATSSQSNHGARMRVSLLDPEERAAHNKEQIGEQLDFDFVQPNLDTRNLTNAMLKGPWSPLELDFQSICQSSNTKQVKVDSNSVNSVVLDTEPTAPISRLLVAACIGIQDRSGSVVARDTTIMPSVPGLLSLMAMLFAPKMELRIDIRQTKYTGVLCGLGPSPDQPDLPVYLDHDAEIIFDTAFDDEDIDSINRIRYLMNLILGEPNKRGGGRVNLSHYQMQVREELLSLLRRPRKTGEEEIWPEEEYVWNRINRNLLLPPSRETFLVQPKDIFAPHFKVRLNLGSSQWDGRREDWLYM